MGNSMKIRTHTSRNKIQLLVKHEGDASHPWTLTSTWYLWTTPLTRCSAYEYACFLYLSFEECIINLEITIAIRITLLPANVITYVSGCMLASGNCPSCLHFCLFSLCLSSSLLLLQSLRLKFRSLHSRCSRSQLSYQSNNNMGLIHLHPILYISFSA